MYETYKIPLLPDGQHPIILDKQFDLHEFLDRLFAFSALYISDSEIQLFVEETLGWVINNFTTNGQYSFSIDSDGLIFPYLHKPIKPFTVWQIPKTIN